MRFESPIRREDSRPQRQSGVPRVPPQDAIVTSSQKRVGGFSVRLKSEKRLGKGVIGGSNEASRDQEIQAFSGFTGKPAGYRDTLPLRYLSSLFTLYPFPPCYCRLHARKHGLH